MNSFVVFFFGFSEFSECVVLLPESTYFFFEFKRVIFYSEVLFRIGFEFGGHLASHCTRKYTTVVAAQYNLFEIPSAYIEIVHGLARAIDHELNVTRMWLNKSKRFMKVKGIEDLSTNLKPWLHYNCILGGERVRNEERVVFRIFGYFTSD